MPMSCDPRPAGGAEQLLAHVDGAGAHAGREGEADLLVALDEGLPVSSRVRRRRRPSRLLRRGLDAELIVSSRWGAPGPSSSSWPAQHPIPATHREGRNTRIRSRCVATFTVCCPVVHSGALARAALLWWRSISIEEARDRVPPPDAHRARHDRRPRSGRLLLRAARPALPTGGRAAGRGADDADWIVLLDADDVRRLAVQQVDELARSTWPSHEVPMQLPTSTTRCRPWPSSSATATGPWRSARPCSSTHRRPGEPLVVLGDPAGHPFCLLVAP